MPHYSPVDLLVVAILLVAAPVSSAFVGRSLDRAAPGKANLLRSYWRIIAQGFLVSSLILLSWHWQGRSYLALGLGLHIGIPGQVGLGLDLLLVGQYAYSLLFQKMSPEKRELLRGKLDQGRIIPRTDKEFALFPLVIIVGSINEELLYRGYLFWLFTPLVGTLGAVAISSIAFGLAHIYQGRSRVLLTGAIGLAFATAYALTASLWWLMLAHVIMNANAYLLALKLKGREAARVA